MTTNQHHFTLWWNEVEMNDFTHCVKRVEKLKWIQHPIVKFRKSYNEIYLVFVCVFGVCELTFKENCDKICTFINGACMHACTIEKSVSFKNRNDWLINHSNWLNGSLTTIFKPNHSSVSQPMYLVLGIFLTFKLYHRMIYFLILFVFK